MISTLLLLFVGFIPTQGNVISPIILIPGLAGSQLEAKLNNESVDPFYCAKANDWFSIWVNLVELEPFIINCFDENMALDYNATSGIFSNASNVEIRAPGFGNTATIEYLTPYTILGIEYMYGLVEPLCKMGYTRGVNIHGAPYDWRLAPDTLVRAGYFQRLRNLIIESYINNSNTPVTLVCHSLGCPTILYFLNSQIPAEWKSKYIHHLVSLSGAWAGSVATVQSIISGSNKLLPVYINPIKVRKSQRTMESTYFLFPSQEVFGNSKPIVTVGSLNNTVANIDQLFRRLNLKNEILMMKQAQLINQGFKDPQVPIFCIHGKSLPTIDKLIYSEDGFPDKEPTFSEGDGDGTVNQVSLETCLKWKDSPGFQHLMIEGEEGEHLSLIYSEQVINAILKVTRM